VCTSTTCPRRALRTAWAPRTGSGWRRRCGWPPSGTPTRSRSRRPRRPHWLFRTAGSAARLVKESGPPETNGVPLGVAVLPGDIVQSVRPLAEQRANIVHWTEFPRGGHFAALEVPDLFTADVAAFFTR
jgi:pimeloyl-ACP methyl ester carboxylesterase